MAMDEAEILKGLRHLKKADPVMREVIKKAGPFKPAILRDPFKALVYSIISQQISGKAAATIRQRLLDKLEGQLTPDRLVQLTKDDLRSVGVSNQKATYMLDLARRVAIGELPLKRLARLPDEEVIEALVQVKGIGVWTAQMFLIFSLGRLDVFPYGDLGVRMALRKLYGLEELPDRAASDRIASPWRPYASLATWYCWRSLEFKE
jgi:DNA-3-methyladenine glycosylase II